MHYTFNFNAVWSNWQYLVSGLGLTMLVTVSALGIGLVIGIAVGVLRLSKRWYLCRIAWASPVDSFIKVGEEQPSLVRLPGPVIGYSKVSFAMKAGDYFFRDWVNYFIDEMQSTGVLLRIFEKYGLSEESLVK